MRWPDHSATSNKKPRQIGTLQLKIRDPALKLAFWGWSINHFLKTLSPRFHVLRIFNAERMNLFPRQTVGNQGQNHCSGENVPKTETFDAHQENPKLPHR